MVFVGYWWALKPTNIAEQFPLVSLQLTFATSLIGAGDVSNLASMV